MRKGSGVCAVGAPGLSSATPIQPASQSGRSAHQSPIARAENDLNGFGELVCRSCEAEGPLPARFIANAYAMRKDGSSWDWPLCSSHMPFAMAAGWFPVREVGEDPPFDPKAHLAAQSEKPE